MGFFFEVFADHRDLNSAPPRRRSGLTAQLDPEAKTGNSNLTTGANRELAPRHRNGAMLAKKFETGAAPPGEARHTAKNPTDKRLRR